MWSGALFRRAASAFIAFLALTLTGFGPPALIESSEAQMPLFAYQVGLVEKVISDAPAISAESAAIVDGPTGRMLYGKNAHARMAPASVTKIMTAILALEKGRLSDYVRVNVDGWAMRAANGSSIMGLAPGEILTLEDLLYGLMLPSGNDAAVAIAEHVGGSVENFVRMMNDKAVELGLKDTHFANPHGLDEEGHYSSAYDLAMIGRYAMRNADFARIVGTRAYVANGKHTYSLLNGNRLLGQYQGVDGVKTGYTEKAGQSFVASVNRDGRRVFVGLIRSSDRYRDARLLFDYFFRDFVWVKLSLPRSPFYKLSEGSESTDEIFVLADKVFPVSLWEMPYLRSFVMLKERVDGVQPALTNDDSAGLVSFYFGDELIETWPLQVR